VTQTPYSPPKTPVADLPPPRSDVRPRAATIALILFGLFILCRCYRLRFTLEQVRTGEISGLGFLLYVAIIGFFIVVGILLAKRMGWARWAVLAIAAWQLYDLHWGLRDLLANMYGVPFGPMDIIIWLAPAAFIVSAAIMIFGLARAWFSGR
jgi:hypothetical protein